VVTSSTCCLPWNWTDSSRGHFFTKLSYNYKSSKQYSLLFCRNMVFKSDLIPYLYTRKLIYQFRFEVGIRFLKDDLNMPSKVLNLWFEETEALNISRRQPLVFFFAGTKGSKMNIKIAAPPTVISFTKFDAKGHFGVIVNH